MENCSATPLYDIKSNTKAWVVVITASLFFFYEFIQMNMFSALHDSLVISLNIDATHYGWLNSAYFYGDLAFLIPAGFILDEFSTRKVLLIATLVSIISAIAFAHLHSFTPALIARFFAGVGNAFSFLACIRLASRWFPPQKMALVTGIVITIAFVGGTFAQTPLTLLVNALNWRNALMATAGLGIFIYFLLWLNVQDAPKDAPHLAHLPQHEKLPLSKVLRSVFINRQNWLAGIYTSLLNLSVFILGNPWGEPFLTETQHLTNVQATNVTSMIFIGTMIGSTFFGWLSDYVGLRKPPMIIAAVLSLVTVVIITYVPHFSYHAYIFLFLLLGFLTASQIITYPLVTESNPLPITGAAVSLSSFLIMAGGAVFTPLFGVILDWHRHIPVSHKITQYSYADFHSALLILPITFAVALFASFFLKETKCRNIAEDGRTS